MYRDHRVAVVIPAYNEEILICCTLDTMPLFIDDIFVVNDGSADRTKEEILIRAAKDPRIRGLASH